MEAMLLFLSVLVGGLHCPCQAIDCLEPGARVISRWTNGNYYKATVESLTNRINVLFDTGVRHSYNTRDYEDILLDRMPDPVQVAWGEQIVVNRPRSRAFQIGYIRGFKNGHYVVMYENGDSIYHTLDQIRIFNSSKACDEPAYLGCYRDIVPRYLEVFIPTHPSTIGACVETCKSQGFSIAGLRNSDLCFCGNQYTKSYQTAENQCDMPCYDNSFESCGGYMAFSQYWTGLVDERRSFRYPGQPGSYGYQQTAFSAAQRHSIPQYGQIPWQTLIQARSQFRNSITSVARTRAWNPAWRARGWGGRSGFQRSFANTRPRANYQKASSNYGPGRPRYRGQAPARYRVTPAQRYGWSYNYYNKQRGQTSSSWRRPPAQAVHPVSRTYPAGGSGKTSQAHGSFTDTLRTIGWKLFGSKVNGFSSMGDGGYRYLGCFKDSTVRDLPVAMDVRPLTIGSCVKKCRDARFSVAGVQLSSQCYCGDSYSRYGRLRNEICTMRCTGNYNEICGGDMKNAIFFTGYGTATPYKDLKAVHQKQRMPIPSAASKLPGQPHAALQRTWISGSTNTRNKPHVKIGLLIKKIDKDLHRVTKAKKPIAKQPNGHSSATAKTKNDGHVRNPEGTARKPLTHKQLKNILAVLSQWPSVEEKPKMEKPKFEKQAVSFQKLKAILDDMTPDFIQSLAYRIVAGKRRGSHRKKAGKQHSTIGKARKITARPRTVKPRLLAADMSKNNSSGLVLSKVRSAQPAGTSQKLNSTTRETGIKAIGLNLWSINKPPRRKSPKTSADAATSKMGAGLPDVGTVRAKDGGKENSSATDSQGNKTKAQEKSEEAEKMKFMNTNLERSSGEVVNKNDSNLSLIENLESSSGSGLVGEGSGGGDAPAQDDVVEVIDQTPNSHGKGVPIAKKQGRISSHLNALNGSEASLHKNESTGKNWTQSNTTALLSKKTLHTLAAGDKRSEISRVLDKHQENQKHSGKSPKSAPAGNATAKRLDGLSNDLSGYKKMPSLTTKVKVKRVYKVERLNSRKTTRNQQKVASPIAKAKVQASGSRLSPKVVAAVVGEKNKANQMGSDKISKPQKTQRRVQGKNWPRRPFKNSKAKSTSTLGGKHGQTKKAITMDYPKKSKNPAGKTVRTVNTKTPDESDTENLDDSNSLNQLISRGSHLSR